MQSSHRLPLGHMPGTGPGDIEIDSPAQALPWAPNPGAASALVWPGGRSSRQLGDRGPCGDREGLTRLWAGRDDY